MLSCHAPSTSKSYTTILPHGSADFSNSSLISLTQFFCRSSVVGSEPSVWGPELWTASGMASGMGSLQAQNEQVVRSTSTRNRSNGLTQILVAAEGSQAGQWSAKSSALMIPHSTNPIPILGIYLAGENQPHVKPPGPLRSYPFTSEIQPNSRPRKAALKGYCEVSDRHEFGELYMNVLRKALRGYEDVSAQRIAVISASSSPAVTTSMFRDCHPADSSYWTIYRTWMRRWGKGQPHDQVRRGLSTWCQA